jgi:hypothetical protein
MDILMISALHYARGSALDQAVQRSGIRGRQDRKNFFL